MQLRSKLIIHFIRFQFPPCWLAVNNHINTPGKPIFWYSCLYWASDKIRKNSIKYSSSAQETSPEICHFNSLPIKYYLVFITCHNAPVFTHVFSLIKPNPRGKKTTTSRYSGCVIYSTLSRFACSTRALQ